jgi:proteasome lid subunit RPN8/RPN11
MPEKGYEQLDPQNWRIQLSERIRFSTIVAGMGLETFFGIYQTTSGIYLTNLDHGVVNSVSYSGPKVKALKKVQKSAKPLLEYHIHPSGYCTPSDSDSKRILRASRQNPNYMAGIAALEPPDKVVLVLIGSSGIKSLPRVLLDYLKLRRNKNTDAVWQQRGYPVYRFGMTLQELEQKTFEYDTQLKFDAVFARKLLV